MNTHLDRSLYWAPRVLGLLFAAFLCLFSLDAFTEGRGIGEAMVATLIHLVPALIVLAVLAVAWRWEWVGAVLFAVLAVLYVYTAWGRLHWTASLVIAGPLALLGVLFSLNGVYRAWARPAAVPPRA